MERFETAGKIYQISLALIQMFEEGSQMEEEEEEDLEYD